MYCRNRRQWIQDEDEKHDDEKDKEVKDDIDDEWKWTAQQIFKYLTNEWTNYNAIERMSLLNDIKYTLKIYCFF